MHATAVTASQSTPAGELSVHTMGQLLQLLRALPSGSIARFVLYITLCIITVYYRVVSLHLRRRQLGLVNLNNAAMSVVVEIGINGIQRFVVGSDCCSLRPPLKHRPRFMQFRTTSLTERNWRLTFSFATIWLQSPHKSLESIHHFSMCKIVKCLAAV